MARNPRGSRVSGDGATKAIVRAYTSPTLVLLAMEVAIRKPPQPTCRAVAKAASSSASLLACKI